MYISSKRIWNKIWDIKTKKYKKKKENILGPVALNYSKLKPKYLGVGFLKLTATLNKLNRKIEDYKNKMKKSRMIHRTGLDQVVYHVLRMYVRTYVRSIYSYNILRVYSMFMYMKNMRIIAAHTVLRWARLEKAPTWHTATSD